MKWTTHFLSLLLLAVISHAQTEQVRVLETKVVSETKEVPDCSGLRGLQAGACAAERQAAQTPVSYSYYTLVGQQNTYVLACQHGGWKECPALIPGRRFTIEVKGAQALLRASGARDLKLRFVSARASKAEGNGDPSVRRCQ